MSGYYTTNDAVVSLEQQKACLAREAKLRGRVYPRWVEEGRMTAEKAQYEIKAMQCAAITISRLKELQDASEEMRAEEEKRQQKLNLKDT